MIRLACVTIWTVTVLIMIGLALGALWYMRYGATGQW